MKRKTKKTLTWILAAVAIFIGGKMFLASESGQKLAAQYFPNLVKK